MLHSFESGLPIRDAGHLLYVLQLDGAPILDDHIFGANYKGWRTDCLRNFYFLRSHSSHPGSPLREYHRWRLWRIQGQQLIHCSVNMLHFRLICYCICSWHSLCVWSIRIHSLLLADTIPWSDPCADLLRNNCELSSKAILECLVCLLSNILQHNRFLFGSKHLWTRHGQFPRSQRRLAMGLQTCASLECFHRVFPWRCHVLLL